MAALAEMCVGRLVAAEEVGRAQLLPRALQGHIPDAEAAEARVPLEESPLSSQSHAVYGEYLQWRQQDPALP